MFIFSSHVLSSKYSNNIFMQLVIGVTLYVWAIKSPRLISKKCLIIFANIDLFFLFCNKKIVFPPTFSPVIINGDNTTKTGAGSASECESVTKMSDSEAEDISISSEINNFKIVI